MDRILKIKCPMMPNFFQYEMPPMKRQDGVQFGHNIPIEEMDEHEAEEFGEMMKQEFIRHWKSKKEHQ